MTRRTPNASARAALTHACILKIVVPPDGLGNAINDWTAWLNAHAPGWSRCETRSLGLDVMGLAFRDPAHAVAFAEAWPGAKLANVN